MPKKSFLSGWQMLFTPEMFLPFLLGGVALNVLGNAIYQLLTNWLTTSSWAVVRIVLGAIAVLFSATILLKRIAFRRYSASPMVNKKPPDKRKGLILLVSNEPTCRKAMEWHQDTLKHCWFLCTETSMEVATKLKDSLPSGWVKAEFVIVNDVYNPIELKEKVEKIYADLPNAYVESDVILDFTGMTAIASVGSVLGCLGGNRAIQYTPGIYNKQLRAMEPLNPIEVVLDWSDLGTRLIKSAKTETETDRLAIVNDN